MSLGYSQSLVSAANKSRSSSLGIALCRLCVKLEIPVSVVAEELGVSRMAVYDWFWGRSTPNGKNIARIHSFMQGARK